MDLDPEGLFRDDSDEDDDNVQVAFHPVRASLSPIFSVARILWIDERFGFLEGTGEGGQQGDGRLPHRRLAQDVHPCDQGEIPAASAPNLINLSALCELKCCN